MKGSWCQDSGIEVIKSYINQIIYQLCWVKNLNFEVFQFKDFFVALYPLKKNSNHPHLNLRSKIKLIEKSSCLVNRPMGITQQKSQKIIVSIRLENVNAPDSMNALSICIKDISKGSVFIYKPSLEYQAFCPYVGSKVLYCWFNQSLIRRAVSLLNLNAHNSKTFFLKKIYGIEFINRF